MRNTRDIKTIFELSRTGRRAARLPACDVPENELADLLPADTLAAAPPALPELSEPQIIRHFVNLSTQNMSVDTHFYPLGSCTMKYNPKRNERAAAMPGGASAGIDVAERRRRIEEMRGPSARLRFSRWRAGRRQSRSRSRSPRPRTRCRRPPPRRLRPTLPTR